MVQERAGRVRRGLRRLRRLLVLVSLVAAGIMTGRLLAPLVVEPTPTAVPPTGQEPPVIGMPGEVPATAPRRSGPPESGPGSCRTLRRAAAVLHTWDVQRAAAYARSDPAALRRLYVAGSRAGLRDLRVLRSYGERGLVVRGLRTQLLSLRVLTAGPGDLRVEVTDRLVGGWAVPADTSPGASRDEGVVLPSDAPTTRVLLLVRRAGQWQVESVLAA